MEYCNQGDLESLLHQKYKEKELSEMEVLSYFREIIDAFRFLQKKKMVHRDIKPKNILVHDGVLKLADFGFCKKYSEENEIMITITGTPLL